MAMILSISQSSFLTIIFACMTSASISSTRMCVGEGVKHHRLTSNHPKNIINGRCTPQAGYRVFIYNPIRPCELTHLSALRGKGRWRGCQQRGLKLIIFSCVGERINRPKGLYYKSRLSTVLFSSDLKSNIATSPLFMFTESNELKSNHNQSNIRYLFAKL